MTPHDHSTSSPATSAPRLTNGPDDGAGSMPLLGLKPSIIEKAGENPVESEDSNRVDLLAPLLGTSFSQSIDNARGSSKRRSPESVCYDKLLRESRRSSGRKSRRTVLVEGGVCYGRSELLLNYHRMSTIVPRILT